MDTVEYFYNFLNEMGAPNILAFGIAVIVVWLLISGIRKGLKSHPPDEDEESHPKGEDESP